jgi:hypothetical protein
MVVPLPVAPLTVATEVLLLSHTPLSEVLVRVIEEPGQTADIPPIGPGLALTVTTRDE